MLVDPEIAYLIDALPMIDLAPDTLAEHRSASAVDERLFDKRLIPEEVQIAGPRGGRLDALLFNPPRSGVRRSAALHFHGGGMVMGSPAMARVFIPQIALDHDMVVLSIDYPLAPETPFPAQLYAGEDALDWLLSESEKLAIHEDFLFLMGESAGGGLAASLALKLRDQGRHIIAGQILTYPMLDHRTGGPDDSYQHGPAGQFIWTRESNAFGWAALAGGRPIDLSSIGWFSPSRAQSLAQLPPTFLATGGLDLFRAENLCFANRLSGAGVSCELHSYSGALHGFDLLRRSRLAQKYRRDLGEWISHMLSDLPSNSPGKSQ